MMVSWCLYHSWSVESHVYCVRGYEHGRIVAAEGSPASLLMFDVLKKKQVWSTPSISADWVYSVAFSPCGSKIAVGCEGFVKVFDAGNGELQNEYALDIRVVKVAFASDGLRLIAADDYRYVIVDSLTGLLVDMQFIPASRGICCPENGQTIVVAGKQSVKVMNGATEMLSIEQNNVCCICTSRDGSRVFVGLEDGHVAVFNAMSGDCLARFKAHDDWVFSLSVSPDDSVFVTGSSDGVIEVWNALSYQRIQSLKGHSDAVRCLSFGAVGSMVSASADKTIRVWRCD